MASSNHERVGRALTFLGQGLYPYVEREMQAVHRDRWLTAATSCLSDDQTLKRNPEDILREDFSALLTVMSRQWAQANIGAIPKYFLIKEVGPAHTKEFTVEVRVGNKKYGEGTGRNKKDAEKRAAENALVKLERQGLV